MKRIQIFCLLLSATALLTTGCTEYKIKQELRHFMRETVTLPEYLESVDKRNISQTPLPEGKAAMVFYYDSLECGSCKVNHLVDLEPLYEMSDSLGTFDVVTVFAPRIEDYDELVRQLMVRNFRYPIYVDTEGIISKTNPCIPDDKRFHSFLINKEGHPVLVGNPVESDRMWGLFIKALDSLK